MMSQVIGGGKRGGEEQPDRIGAAKRGQTYLRPPHHHHEKKKKQKHRARMGRERKVARALTVKVTRQPVFIACREVNTKVPVARNLNSEVKRVKKKFRLWGGERSLWTH